MLNNQNTMMEQLLEILTLTNNTNKIVDKTFGNHPLEPCQSVSSSGVYQINCDDCSPTSEVYCDADSFDGGWLVVQQRLDGSLNFTRSWTEYRNGFGTPGKSTEFWLGLEALHQITTSGEYELSIELKDERYNEYGYARYTDFKVAGEREKYRMSHLGEHSGMLPDMLSSHKGRRFSTFDQDNDDWGEVNCSVRYYSGGGWWYRTCAQCALNGQYTKNKVGNGISWAAWTDAASYSRMMIRRI
uniref:Tenascin-N n=1 Tax=Culex pipiens TaxID=7175 RepID=A0A8D8K3Q9_CULPI